MGVTAFATGNRLLQEGKLEEAIASYQKSIEENPQFAHSYQNLAIALEKTGRIEEAIAALRQAVAINPEDPWFLYKLGIMLNQQGQFQEAVDYLCRALDLKKDVSEFYLGLGSALVKLGQWEEAVEYINQAGMLNGKVGKFEQAEIYFYLAEAKSGQEQWSEAVELYRQSWEINPDRVDCCIGWAKALGKLGRLDEAVDLYHQMVALSGESGEIWFALGQTLGQLDRWEEAVSKYAQAISVGFAGVEVRHHLGFALLKLARWQEAVIEYRLAVEINPNSADIRHQLGYALIQLQYWGEAEIELRKAVELHPGSAVFWQQLGDVLWELGKRDEAEKAYRQVLELKLATGDALIDSSSVQKRRITQTSFTKGNILNSQNQKSTCLNVLFVLYGNIDSKDGYHAQLYGNQLLEQGVDCLFAVPDRFDNEGVLRRYLYNISNPGPILPYSLLSIPGFRLPFANGSGPDVIHAWTPREIVRKCVEKLLEQYSCSLVIHLEDNEEYLTSAQVGRPFTELVGLPETELDLIIPGDRYHPIQGKAFLNRAQGLTMTIETLKDFNIGNVPELVLSPPVDESLFYPRPINYDLRRSLGIAEGHVVLAYAGNVDSGNRYEVRQLYQAVEILNQQGCPTVLLRTGLNGEGMGVETWERTYEKYLGWVEREQVPEILAAADILVQPGVPGVSNDQHIPSKLLEYFAMGRSVVLPKTNLGLRVKHGLEGYVLERCNAQSIAGAVQEIKADGELARRLSDGAVDFYLSQVESGLTGVKLNDFYSRLTGKVSSLKDEKRLGTTFFVVTPCLNAVATIDETIKSVISQSGDFWIRYHIQDGGSTDATIERLQYWEGVLSAGSSDVQCRGVEFSWVSERDEGMYDAVMKGFDNFEIAPRGLMTWINADDVLMPGALSAICRIIGEHPEVEWVGGPQYVFETDVQQPIINQVNPTPTAVIREGLCDGKHWVTLQQEGMFFSKRLWFKSKHGLKGFELAGDWNLWREMAHHGVYYQYESPLGAFRSRSGQLSVDRIEDYRAEIERVVPLEVRKGRFEELYRQQEWGANLIKFDGELGTTVLKVESVQRLFDKRGNEGIDVGEFISKINEETSLIDANQNLGKLIVITTLGSQAVSMPQPVMSAFKKHAQNSYISEVHVLSEDDLTWLKNLCQDIGYDFEKFKYISVERRPTFSMLISYANRLTDRENSENCICALMNSDISFGCDDDVASCLSSINSISQEQGKVVYALTRQDYVESDWQLTLYESTGLPNNLSADCWVFSSPINLPQADFYSIGQMNCDLMLGYDLVTSGFQIYNPCLDLEIHHHESELKTNDYYNEQNQKTSNHDLLSLHYGRRRNEPFEVFGFSWISYQWLKIGYRPLPYSSLRKKLYVTLSEPLRGLLIYSLFSIEIFAKERDFDLVFVTDCSLENLFLQLKPIGLLNRNVYFVKLRNTIDEFIIELMKGNQWNFNKLAILSDPSLLTHSIADYTQALVLDFRSWQLYPPSEGEILCPEITGDYKSLVTGRYENFVDQPFVNESRNRENKRLCTLVTSVYKSDSFINSFFANSEELIGYSDQINHIALISEVSDYEADCIKDWLYRNRNAILLWHKEDPSLYECWNIGIRLAQTEFVSNANVDDMRHPKHVTELVADLQDNPHLCVAASALVPFETYATNIEEIDSSQPWYAEEAGEFGFTSLAHLEVENGTYKLKPHNLPHCMPIWRKQLHDIYGFFDEKRYGTYSDWAFWLKVTKAGERGYLNPAPLSYYYINLNSHNRRANNLDRLHREIEIEYFESFYFRLNINTIPESSYSIFRLHQGNQRLFEPKLNLYTLTQSFGQHRNSFNKLIESLLPLDIGESGIKFLPFIERYFVWGDAEGEASSYNPQPLDKEWIGIIHVPFNAPVWFEPRNSPENIFQTQLWIDSLPFCKGLICLTADLRKDVQEWYPNLPTLSAPFPTELNDVKPFDFTAYQRFPRIVQVGDWLRKLQSIYQLHTQSHQKLILIKPCTREYMRREIEVFGDCRNDSVTELEFVSNQEYDSLLSSSVVLCLLYATAANNLVIECIARGTPILINPLPSVIEYLGEDYPLYVKDIYEAETLLKQENKIQAASDYLLKHQKYIDLSYQAWLENIGQSDFYNNL